jgi:hypothetical protein
MSNDLSVPVVSRYAQLAGREVHWLDWVSSGTLRVTSNAERAFP